jgi:toxin CptA
MHAAPSVIYPVGRSPFAGWLYAALAFGGLLAAVAWSVQSAFGWRQGVALAAVFACGALALCSWRHSPTGALRWDGVGWSWEEGASLQAGQPEIALDLQSRLLLRWVRQDGAPRWFWVERASDASHWEALRRAVYSRASAPIPSFPPQGKQTLPAGEPPAAEP